MPVIHLVLPARRPTPSTTSVVLAAHAKGASLVPSTHRSPAKGVVGGAALMLAAALPWQDALAEHCLIAAVSVCSQGSFPQSCDSHQVSSTGPEIGTQVLFGGDQASALQGYGIFHGSAEASIQTMGTSGDYAVVSTAGGRATDTWILGGGTGAGTLQFTWSIDGRTATSGSGPGYDSDAWLMIEAYGNSHPPAGSAESSYATTGFIYGGFGSYRMSAPVSFYFGQALDITFASTVHAGTGFSSDYGLPSFTGSAQADFSHTAILTGIQAYDAQGSLIPAITISAESGTLYPLSPVPEPASAALMAVGAGLLAWRQRAAALWRAGRRNLLG